MSNAVRFRCQPLELLCERPGLNPELLHPLARPPGLPSDLLRTSVLPGRPPKWTGQSSLYLYPLNPTSDPIHPLG